MKDVTPHTARIRRAHLFTCKPSLRTPTYIIFMESNKRLAAYDVMRIIAIVLVLLNHLPVYFVFSKSTGLALVGGTLLSVVVRIGVPLFAMVSGALLLGRNESYRDLWRKRIVRMLLVLVIFEALLSIEFHFVCGYPLTPMSFVRGVLGGTLKALPSYWFLYAYLGFLIMLPFLRRIAQAMTRADFLWLMGVHVVLTTLPLCLKYVCDMNAWPAMPLSTSLAVSLSSVTLYFYPLIGYWIDRNVDVERITRRKWSLIAAVTLFGIALSSLMTIFYTQRVCNTTQSFLNVTVYVTAMAVFVAVKRIFNADFALRRPRLNSLLCFVGSLVFGVYLLDQALKAVIYEPLKSLFYAHLPFDPLGLSSPLCFSLAWVCITLVVCGFVTWLLKHLPVFRTLL